MTNPEVTGVRLRRANGLAAAGSLALAGFFLYNVMLINHGLAEPFMRVTTVAFGGCAVIALGAWGFSSQTRIGDPEDSIVAAQVGLIFGLLPSVLLVAWWLLQTYG